MATITNLFAGIVADSQQEQFDLLHESTGIRIKRIVSLGQASPPDFWYDQPADEWVIVIQGAARLRFEDESEARELRAGDFVFIAAHRRHRVEWTDPAMPTVWLAVHFREPAYRSVSQ